MTKPVHIFISYCHEDHDFRQRLEDHMVALKRDGSCDAWTDREILVGDTMDKKISCSLNEADIVLLLVSIDFLNSDYCMSKEFKEALQRKKKTGYPRIIPIIARACDWMSIPELAELKSTLDGTPIKEFQNMDEAYLGIVKEIRKVIQKIKNDIFVQENYYFPTDDDSLILLYIILEYGKLKNRRWTGVTYMQRNGSGSNEDMISLSLIPEAIDTYFPTFGFRRLTKFEFFDMANILHDCGIFNSVIVDQTEKWIYHRYRINIEVDLDALKKRVDQAIRERGLKEKIQKWMPLPISVMLKGWQPEY